MVAGLETHEDGRADVSSKVMAALECGERKAMSSITINLPEEHHTRLQEIAERLGISLEDLTRMSIEELLAWPDVNFENAADRVLKKNEELYRRLA